MRDMLLSSIYILYLFVGVIDSATVNFRSYTNSGLTNLRFEPLTTRLSGYTVLMCAAQCESTTNCVSFSYHPGGLCELNKYNPNDVMATNFTENDWSVYTKFDETCWPATGYGGFVRDGTCYFWVSGTPTVPWSDGQTVCQTNGAELVCIESEAENQALVDRVPVWLWWFGLNDNDEDGVFTCNGANPVFLKWAPNKPGDALCVAVQRSDKLWYDGTCSATIAYVCEKKLY